MPEDKKVLICGAPDLPEFFFPLIAKGVVMDVMTGGSLKVLLAHQLGIAYDYINREIQTVFLNFKAIDDMDRTLIGNGDVLALSGPMPGLVGATLRRGGRYAAMRREISGEMTASESLPAPGRIRLKLFNSVLDDLGAMLLARGVHVQQTDLKALLTENELRLMKTDVALFLGSNASHYNAVVAAMETGEECGLKVIAT